MNTLSLFDGDFGAFDESASYNFVPNKRPHFLFFSKRPGRLKGRIRYTELTCIPDLDIEGQVLSPRSLVCVSMCECVPPCMLNLQTHAINLYYTGVQCVLDFDL